MHLGKIQDIVLASKESLVHMSREMEINACLLEDFNEAMAEEYYGACEWEHIKMPFRGDSVEYKQFRVGCNGLRV